MNTWKVSDTLKEILEKGLSFLAYGMPLMEALYFFGPRVFLYSGDVNLKNFFFTYLRGPIMIYQDYIGLSFFFTVAIFGICSRNTLPMSKTKLGLTDFLRINVMQGALVQVMFTCGGQIFQLSPLWFKYGILGSFISHGCIFGIFGLVLYSAFLIFALKRFPLIPIVTASARIQMWIYD
jgi:hypothetical protein